MDRRDWLLRLKVGDKVGVTRRGGATRHTIATITRIGVRMFTTEKHGSFSRQTGAQGSTWDTWDICMIVPLTDEIRDAIRRARHVVKLRATRWDKLSLPLLNQVLALIRNEVVAYEIAKESNDE